VKDTDIIESLIVRPLQWQERGLSFTASGYGSRIPTVYVASCFDKKIRRVYCTTYSNVGTCWIKVKGEKIVVTSDTF
jgi:hypothetical protein